MDKINWEDCESINKFIEVLSDSELDHLSVHVHVAMVKRYMITPVTVIAAIEGDEDTKH